MIPDVVAATQERGARINSAHVNTGVTENREPYYSTTKVRFVFRQVASGLSSKKLRWHIHIKNFKVCAKNKSHMTCRHASRGGSDKLVTRDLFLAIPIKQEFFYPQCKLPIKKPRSVRSAGACDDVKRTTRKRFLSGSVFINQLLDDWLIGLNDKTAAPEAYAAVDEILITRRGLNTAGHVNNTKSVKRGKEFGINA